MAYQRFGRAWAKECTSFSGALIYRSVATMSCVAVPSEMKASPGAMAPRPTAPTAASPPPAARITPRGSPSASAASGRIRPAGAAPSNKGGAQAGSASQAAKASGDQARLASSRSQVPAASLMSEPRSPLSLRRRWSFGERSEATRRRWSGSFLVSHLSFGPVKPGIGFTPTIRARSGWSRASSSASRKARPSLWRMAGRTGLSARSRTTAPCIWPEKPIALSPPTAAPATPLISAIAPPMAATQSSGFCSDQPGRGRSGA